jgi:hypothetical protein
MCSIVQHVAAQNNPVCHGAKAFCDFLTRSDRELIPVSSTSINTVSLRYVRVYHPDTP